MYQVPLLIFACSITMHFLDVTNNLQVCKVFVIIATAIEILGWLGRNHRQLERRACWLKCQTFNDLTTDSFHLTDFELKRCPTYI